MKKRNKSKQMRGGTIDPNVISHIIESFRPDKEKKVVLEAGIGYGMKKSSSLFGLEEGRYFVHTLYKDKNIIHYYENENMYGIAKRYIFLANNDELKHFVRDITYIKGALEIRQIDISSKDGWITIISPDKRRLSIKGDSEPGKYLVELKRVMSDGVEGISMLLNKTLDARRGENTKAAARAKATMEKSEAEEKVRMMLKALTSYPDALKAANKALMDWNRDTETAAAAKEKVQVVLEALEPYTEALNAANKAVMAEDLKIKRREKVEAEAVEEQAAAAEDEMEAMGTGLAKAEAEMAAKAAARAKAKAKVKAEAEGAAEAATEEAAKAATEAAAKAAA